MKAYADRQSGASGFEQTEEARRPFYLPRDAAQTPEEAVDLLFRSFMDAMRERVDARAFTVTEILETDCRIYSREDIEESWAAGEGYDWGYAFVEYPSPQALLEENQWVTFCNAVIRYEGFLFYRYSWPNLGMGSDELHWGRLTMDEEQWIFEPVGP